MPTRYFSKPVLSGEKMPLRWTPALRRRYLANQSEYRKSLTRNLVSRLSPGYLFFSGDRMAREWTGEWCGYWSFREFFCYKGKHFYYKINLLTFSFFSATSNISLMQKCNNILDSRIVTWYHKFLSILLYLFYDQSNSLIKINFSIRIGRPQIWCMDVCMYRKYTLFFIRTSKFWLRLNCS